MLRSTHIAVTGVIVSGYLWWTKPSLLIDGVSLLGAWIGVQLPDLDTGNTWLNRRLGFLSRLISRLFKHRTWTHSIWAILLMFTLAYFSPIPSFLDLGSDRSYLRIFYQMVAWGYLLHVCEDAFSREGVCWLYPFQRFQRSRDGFYYRKRPWHWFYYRTGGIEEMVIRWIAWLGLVYLLFRIILDSHLK